MARYAFGAGNSGDGDPAARNLTSPLPSHVSSTEYAFSKISYGFNLFKDSEGSGLQGTCDTASEASSVLCGGSMHLDGLYGQTTFRIINSVTSSIMR
jgi:hypothetical protein